MGKTKSYIYQNLLRLLRNLVKNEQRAFDDFVEHYALDEQQAGQFKQYLSLLLQARKNFNLTAIDTVIDTIDFHFRDSLALVQCMDMNSVTMIADVGTGGGFPGIPLKILFPHLAVVLIEVNGKKRDFLHEVVNLLQLKNVEISDLDWRTFLRKAQYPVELFVARASLHTDELIRLFQPSCPFANATLVYWASRHWELSAYDKPFFIKECLYAVQEKMRKLIFFKKPL